MLMRIRNIGFNTKTEVKKIVLICGGVCLPQRYPRNFPAAGEGPARFPDSGADPAPEYNTSPPY